MVKLGTNGASEGQRELITAHNYVVLDRLHRSGREDAVLCCPDCGRQTVMPVTSYKE